MTDAKKTPAKKTDAAARQKRLEEVLRENLKKRKYQARKRSKKEGP